MSEKWDYNRSASFLQRLREDVARFGEPIATNVSLDEIDPGALVVAGAGGLVVTEDEHLVFVRRTDMPAAGDLLVTPGGEVEPGEAPSEAFVREVREETGLDIEVDSLAVIYAMDEPGYSAGETALWIEFIGYARGGRLNDCVDREADIGEAVAIRCDEVTYEQVWSVLDRLLLHLTACGPPEVTREELLDQFARLGRRWPSTLEDWS